MADTLVSPPPVPPPAPVIDCAAYCGGARVADLGIDQIRPALDLCFGSSEPPNIHGWNAALITNVQVIDRSARFRTSFGIDADLFCCDREVRLLLERQLGADRGNCDDEWLAHEELAEGGNERVRVDRSAAAGVELEVKVRIARRVAGVAHDADLLTRRNVAGGNGV